MPNGIQQYVKLEERLVLLAWLNDLFGCQCNRELLADMKEAAEGFDVSGRSSIHHGLMARGDKVKIPPADLARYDDNANAYQHDEKAQLHEVLPKLSREIGARSRRKCIRLDSYIISATPYEDLRKRYDDGSWDRERFAARHILFLERNSEYDFMARMFTEQVAARQGGG
jgi:hypothetical protein